MIGDYQFAKGLDAELSGIHHQLSHYLAEIESKRVANHHHYSVSVGQLKGWVAKIESLTATQKATLTKVNPVWTDTELASLRDSLLRIDAVLHPAIEHCLHDGCWSLVEIESLRLNDEQLAAIAAAIKQELGG